MLAAGTLSATGIAKAVGIELVNVSHHVNLLKHIGLVSLTEPGRFNECGLLGVTVTATHLTLTHESGVVVTIPLRRDWLRDERLGGAEAQTREQVRSAVVAKSEVPASLEGVKAKGREPCSVCNPPE